MNHRSNTEIYNVCKLQCSASFLFWYRASNSSTNDSKSIVCARFDSIDKRGGVDGTDSTRAARSDCSTNVRWLSLYSYRRHSASRLAASASFTTISNDAAWNFEQATSLVEVGCMVTGQLADKPTRGQSSRGLDNSRTGQLAEMFDLKFGVYNSTECYFRQITLFIHCQYSIGLGLRLGLMYK